MRWRGVEIAELDDATLLDALRQALAICAEMWREVARRKIVRQV
jgi:hypothetical protein